MPTSGRAQAAEVLVDTSVAVALVVSDHTSHAEVVAELAGRPLGLAGHAAFETFSVLTRLPPPARPTPGTVTELLAFNFPATRFLGPVAAAELLGRLAGLGLSGGSVYDALVGATAVEHGMRLITRDRRALGKYRALEVDVELLT
jgi:predicted nucleic acid-binding protein